MKKHLIRSLLIASCISLTCAVYNIQGKEESSGNIEFDLDESLLQELTACGNDSLLACLLATIKELVSQSNGNEEHAATINTLLEKAGVSVAAKKRNNKN